MIDEQRAEQWATDAKTALTHHYGKEDTAAHLAAIVLALLQDRQGRERFIERSGSR